MSLFNHHSPVRMCTSEYKSRDSHSYSRQSCCSCALHARAGPHLASALFVSALRVACRSASATAAFCCSAARAAASSPSITCSKAYSCTEPGTSSGHKFITPVAPETQHMCILPTTPTPTQPPPNNQHMLFTTISTTPLHDHYDAPPPPPQPADPPFHTSLPEFFTPPLAPKAHLELM
jgi:hypothetical protein